MGKHSKEDPAIKRSVSLPESMQHYRELATEERGAAWFAQTPENVCSNSATSS